MVTLRTVSRSSGSERPLEHSFLLPNEVPGKHSGRFLADAANADFSAAVDKGESSIIQKYIINGLLHLG